MIKELFEAVQTGDVEQVRAIVAADPDIVTEKNDKGQSALLMACYTGQKGVRDLLVAQSGPLELHEAAAAGSLCSVQRILEASPELANSFSPDGFPVMALAAVFGHEEVARYLHGKGAEIHAAATNGSGYNALTGAVASGHTSIVKWLLESGADANYRYASGYSPLLTAAANGHLEIVKMLLAHGADAGAKTNDGKSALDLATERKQEVVASLLRSLPQNN